MSRIRAILLSMGLVIVVLLAQSLSHAQGPPGGGGGRGGRGGGPGGFGGRPRISSPLTLASNVYVQEDLKMTDAQKTQVKSLSEKYDEQRRALFPRRRGEGDNAQGKGAPDAAPDANAANAGGRTRGGPQAKGGDTAKGTDANAGANRGRRGGNNAPNGAPGGFGGFGNNGGGGRPDFAAMQGAMEKLRVEAEGALSKILTKPQRERILQIQLQQEGPMAVTQPAMQKKLNMSPLQIEQIAMIVNQRDQSQDQLRESGRQLFQSFQTPDGGFDRDAMRAKMQDPQFKAQMDKMRDTSTKQREQLQDQTITMIGKTLTKKQHQNFAKMQGPPFDLDKLDRNYDPAKAAAKEKEEAEAEKSTTSKKKTATKSRRST